MLPLRVLSIMNEAIFGISALSESVIQGTIYTIPKKLQLSNKQLTMIWFTLIKTGAQF